MAIADALISRNSDLEVEGWLPVDEVLRRIVVRLPLAVVDRERGDRIVRENVVRLVEVSAHAVVLNSWRAMEGQVAYVTIREAVGGPQFGFFMGTQTTIFEIDYERAEPQTPVASDVSPTTPIAGTSSAVS